MTYYIKGGSKYNEANPTVWCALNLLGFTEAKYLDANWKQIDYEGIIDSQDPFWLFGSASGGAKEVEIGLYNDRRIKIDTTGIYGWDGDSWEDLIGGGVGGDNLGNHIAEEALQMNAYSITSNDADLTYYFGRGVITGASDNVSFGHRDQITALTHTSLGRTILNTALGQTMYFRINNVNKMQMNTSALTMSVPIILDTGQYIQAGLITDSYHTKLTSNQLQFNRAGYSYIDQADLNGYIVFRINSVDKMSLAPTLLTMSVPIEMGGNAITSSGALDLKVSGDNDDYLQFSTTSEVPIIKRIGGPSTHIQSDDATWVNFGVMDTFGQRLTLEYHKGDHWGQIYCDGSIAMVPSGNATDYLNFYTSAGIPRIKVIGGSQVIFESADANYVILGVHETDSKYTQIQFNKTSETGVIKCSGALDIIASGDASNYVRISTTTNVPQISFIGGNGLITNVADPTNNQDVATKKWVEDNSHAKQHAMDDTTEHTSSDIATLDSSISKHGFLKKLDNNATNFMNGEGNWAVPAGEGGVTFLQIVSLLSGSGAVQDGGHIELTDNSRVGCWFPTETDWDDTKDLLIRVPFVRRDANADTVGFRQSISCKAYDASESATIWDIENFTVVQLPACAANFGLYYTYTIAAADWTKGEVIRIMLHHDEAGRTIWMGSASISYA